MREMEKVSVSFSFQWRFGNGRECYLDLKLHSGEEQRAFLVCSQCVFCCAGADVISLPLPEIKLQCKGQRRICLYDYV
jgi:hypothetical protein